VEGQMEDTGPVKSSMGVAYVRRPPKSVRRPQLAQARREGF
jgi:hypothetical protein